MDIFISRLIFICGWNAVMFNRWWWATNVVLCLLKVEISAHRWTVAARVKPVTHHWWIVPLIFTHVLHTLDYVGRIWVLCDGGVSWLALLNFSHKIDFSGSRNTGHLLYPCGSRFHPPPPGRKEVLLDVTPGLRLPADYVGVIVTVLGIRSGIVPRALT